MKYVYFHIHDYAYFDNIWYLSLNLLSYFSHFLLFLLWGFKSTKQFKFVISLLFMKMTNHIWSFLQANNNNNRKNWLYKRD